MPAAAEQAGFRACRRCKPLEAVRRDPHVLLAERTCRLLESAAGGRVTLASMARGLGVSAPHLQRVFRRVTGVSPRAYAEHLRAGRLRASLKSGSTVSRALYDAVTAEPDLRGRSAGFGMTPATLARGAAERITSWGGTALGKVLVAHPRGLCFVTRATRARGRAGTGRRISARSGSR